MDPEATLNAAEANVAAGKKASGWRALQEFDRAGQKLEDYWAWRRRGGFEPPKGDRRAEDIAEELSEAWEKESDRVERDRATHADYWENPAAERAHKRTMRSADPEFIRVRISGTEDEIQEIEEYLDWLKKSPKRLRDPAKVRSLREELKDLRAQLKEYRKRLKQVERAANPSNTGIRLSAEDFDGLQPKDRVFIQTSGGFSAGEREFEVGRKSYSKKYKVESKRLYPIRDGKPVKKGIAKWTLYKRDDGRVSLAHGDMGTIIHSFRRANPEPNPRGDKTWIVEMTINSRVRPVRVKARNREAAKDAAEAKHPDAERTWNAYTLKEWRDISARSRSREENPDTTSAADLVRRLKF